MSLIGNIIGKWTNKVIAKRKGVDSEQYKKATERMELYSKFQDSVKDKVKNSVFKNSGIKGYFDTIQHGDKAVIEKVLFVAPLKSASLGIKNNVELFNELEIVNEIVGLIDKTDFERLNSSANRRDGNNKLAALFKKSDDKDCWVFTYKKNQYEVHSKKGVAKINKALERAKARSDERKLAEEKLRKRNKER